jgi:nickel transport protein
MPFWIWILLLALAAGAHELELEIAPGSPAVVVRAKYGGTEPVPFAKVQVFAPGGTREFQTGRTDQQGRFVFAPAEAGAWRVVVDDELGHRVERTVDVSAGSAGVPVRGAASRWERLLAGLGLLAGAAGFGYGWSSRRKIRAIPHQPPDGRRPEPK